VVVIPVIDAIGKSREQPQLPDLPADQDVHALVRDMRDLVDQVTVKTYREVYNEATSNKETMHSLFDLGYLSLLERATIESLYNQILQRVARVVAQLDYVPEEFEALTRKLADKYVCNFSLFQSLPDHWAIQALFPIAPLARLNERPTRDATLVDISCDSDGKIEKFIDLRDVKNTLPLHELREGEPYYLGIFLSGAYQDVLANAHNLFGRVNEAHVRVTADDWELERFVKGAKARRLIENMGYETPELLGWLREETAERVSLGVMTEEEATEMAELYDYELVGYTYLEEM
jgi:arginine decarboxylase